MDYSKKKLFYGAFIFIFFIIFFGAVTTFVQYNKTEFSSIDIFLVGINFIFQRVLIDPSLTAIQLVYETFLFGSDKLYFRYSRLGFLFGQNYVGTETDNSLFVAPVGFIADTWRNVGSFGLGIVGIILGYIVFYADSRIKNMETLNAFVVVYLFIATIMFLVYGVLFSMGAFSQLIFLLLVLKSKKYNNSKISLQ
jgi:hypothetical protein